MQLVMNTLPALERKNFCVSVFIDFSKAFDCVDNAILLDKMYKLGIRGVPHKLITSYLTDRAQSVVVDSVESDKSKISIGVPQGSCNGPLLYLIYANDIIKVLLEADAIFYADDTVILVTRDSLQDIEGKLNMILTKLMELLDHGSRQTSSTNSALNVLPTMFQKVSKSSPVFCLSSWWVARYPFR